MSIRRPFTCVMRECGKRWLTRRMPIPTPLLVMRSVLVEAVGLDIAKASLGDTLSSVKYMI